MIKNEFLKEIAKEMEDLKAQGLYKGERNIVSPQSALIKLDDGREVLNFCANNYLGLADNKELIKTAKEALDKYGYGTGSVRFICGTMDVHTKLEKELAKFLNYEACITFVSCWSANNGVFAALLTEEDAIISANLNHASLIDGIRLAKAQKFFYQFNDMKDLEEKIKEAVKVSKNKLIVTDGVFSMDGDIAPLKAICDLADKYDCMVLVDDSHATGFIGAHGRGTAEYCGVEGRIDILTSTLGKALGGAGGGLICSKKEIVDKLRNKARPYLFSNNISPMVASVTLKVLEMLKDPKLLIDKVMNNTKYFREKMVKAGFNIRLGTEGVHPVAPVMLGDAKLTDDFAKEMVKEGVYVVGFSFPVVPKGEARIRVQNSAAHSKEQLDQCINTFIKVGKKFGVIK
jgi:glycine C-acetyltransferase